MTSSINTSTISTDYPAPGVNNSSQGFRDNFTSIKRNIDTAATEITELQSKVILKSPLAGTILNNDMTNNLIKNAQTLAFRSSTRDLGSNLSGQIAIDITLGDVHYGIMTGNILLGFYKWAPDKTMSSVRVVLDVVAGQTISLPSNVVYGVSTIEGLDQTTRIITVPSGVTRLHYIFNTLDCGTTIEIVPVDRPRLSNGVVYNTPWSPVTGAITLTLGSSTVTGIGTSFVTELSVGDTITDAFSTVIGVVATIVSATELTLVSPSTLAVTGAIKKLSSVGAPGDRRGATLTDGSYLYVCAAQYDGVTPIWRRAALSSY